MKVRLRGGRKAKMKSKGLFGQLVFVGRDC